MMETKIRNISSETRSDCLSLLQLLNDSKQCKYTIYLACNFKKIGVIALVHLNVHICCSFIYGTILI